MGTIKLKPCPFCGSEAEMDVKYNSTYRYEGYWIQGKCLMCGAKSKVFFTKEPRVEVGDDELEEVIRMRKEKDTEGLKIYHERREEKRYQLIYESDAMKRAIQAWNTRIGEVNDTK